MTEVSQKQLEANRRNAKLGGVKTAHGKTRSRYNSLKHGLLSKEVLLQGENGQFLTNLGWQFILALQPATAIERFLVDRIIADAWRLRRVMQIEREMMERANDAYYKLKNESEDIEKKILEETRNYSTEERHRVADYIREVLEQRKKQHLTKDETEEKIYSAKPARNTEIMAPLFGSESTNYDAYDRLIRYEASIERGFYKALHELQRLQAIRKGEKLPLAALDIDISSNG
jgi:hypothetical protein